MWLFNEHERLIGETAKIQANSNLKNTIFDSKRLIEENIVILKYKKILKNGLLRLKKKQINLYFMLSIKMK